MRNESGGQTTGEAFVSYLEELRDRAGIWSNTELAERVREVGSPRFNASVISKWKTGATDPGIESLRAIAKVLGVDPIHLFLKAGLVVREDLGQRHVDPVYEDLVQLDHDIEDHELSQVRDELQRLRAHISILVATTRGTVERIVEESGKKMKPVRRRRKAS
ncbi:helix-turn-helix domain-containing protein [Glycomyces tenuis]|uniref:helix-turn-helix domain-containing protein n=1 Tax=Glycomyces tenuis TaxID=58116 RepID=UPI0004169F71|nr:helix-turn-helix transcriptional regulator [Glycomyces tenuis]